MLVSFIFIWILLCWFGAYTLMRGLSEFRENYLKEKELKNLEFEVKKLRLEKEQRELKNN